jgi:hypothetical protein
MFMRKPSLEINTKDSNEGGGTNTEKNQFQTSRHSDSSESQHDTGEALKENVRRNSKLTFENLSRLSKIAETSEHEEKEEHQ